MLYHQPRKE